MKVLKMKIRYWKYEDAEKEKKKKTLKILAKVTKQINLGDSILFSEQIFVKWSLKT